MLISNIPFYSQHWDLVHWKELGFKSFADAEYWERSSCGVLCIKMILDYFLKKSGRVPLPSLFECIQSGVALGAYQDAVGWSHQGLVTLVKHFGFSATQKNISSEKLYAAVDANSLPIISIKWGFKNKKTWKERILFWKKFGGHLAVVVGYEKNGEVVTGYYVHHTSKIESENWQQRFVPIADFTTGYTGRCIVVTF